MAHNAIDLPPHLTPWRLAGVEHLLAVCDVPPELSLCTPDIAPKAQAHKVHTPRAQASRAQSAVARPVPAPASASPYTQKPSSNSIPDDVPLTIAPPEQWPVLWQERLRVTRSAPVLWTYWALGEDLCGTPNAARRGLLQRLLADLGHPAGTHCFWPVALPDANGLVANAGAFWGGVVEIKARALVVMGSAALKALGLPAQWRPFQQPRYKGRCIVVLPDMDALIAQSHNYETVRAFVREALAPFAAHMRSLASIE